MKLTTEQRLELIKAMMTGNIACVQKIHEETTAGQVSTKDCRLAACYLLEYGRPAGFDRYVEEQPASFNSTADIDYFTNQLEILETTGSYEAVSMEGLKQMMEATECYRILKKNNQLHLLNKYKLK